MEFESIDFFRAILGSLLGLLGMTALGMWIAPAMGMPRMNPAALLATKMQDNLTLGWIAHIMIGIILGIIYALIQHYFPGPAAMRGALFSVIPWLIAQVMLMPMMGKPLFMGSKVMAMQSLIGHLIYGVILGLVYQNG